jgi:hypothetical protein
MPDQHAYLLFEAHPANTMPYNRKGATAVIYNTPTFSSTSESDIVFRIMKCSTEGNNARIIRRHHGDDRANTKMILSALAGIILLEN